MGDPAPGGLPKQGELIAGKYRVQRLLGRGGMGIVVAATHEALRQTVAVKFLLPEANHVPEAIERFFREARTAASIRNEHVAHVMDVGMLENGSPYLVMEYLTGIDLSELLATRKRLPATEAVDYVLQACEALIEVHRLGLAHRDLKPGNLFLAEGAGGVPTIKVLDFGISKVVDPSAMALKEKSLTETATMLGSVYYMAPEQIRSGKPIDARVDIWALGVILHQLITGHRPFQGNTTPDVLVKITSDPPPSFQALGITAPAGLQEVVLWCMEKDRDRRPPSIAELAMALTPFGTSSARGSIERILGPQAGTRIPTLKGMAASRAPSSPPPRPPSIASETPIPVAAGSSSMPAGTDVKPRETRPAESGKARIRWGVGLGVIAAFFAAGFTGVWAFLRAPIPLAATEIDAERLASFAPLPEAPPGPERPVAVAKIKLGRALFYEPKLSRNSDISCNSCHFLDRYGVDGKRLSRGTNNREPPRNALSVYNIIGFFALMWDGRSQTLEEQAEEVLFASDAMDMPKDRISGVIRQMPAYVSAFKEAFPDEPEPVVTRNALRAIAAFEGSLVTRGRWDRFLEGDKAALNDDEKAGFNRFVEVGCVSCHRGASVGATMFQKVGLVKAWPNTKDRGRFEITRREADWMVFRVPSLRNVAATAPYFHDGSVASLEESIRLMARHQIGRELEEADVVSILAWLKCLTGEIPQEAINPVAPRK